MGPMDACEQQLTRVATQVAGPERSVAAMAIVRSAKAVPERRLPVLTRWFRGGTTAATEGGFSMLSAVKLVVAAAIVALFGGFLLAGILSTQPSDEMTPAVVTESPSPMTTEELLSGMVTEEVEPGVLRVINDGRRDLPSVDNRDIVAGYDGGIWLLRVDRFLRLGGDESHVWPDSVGPEYRVLEVAPDGTRWVIPSRGLNDLRGGPGLRSTDGEEWTVQPCPGTRHGMTVAPDGTLWASWIEGDRTRVGHLGSTGWQPLDGYVDDFTVELDRLLITDAGDLYGISCSWVCAFWHFDDGIWQRERNASELVDVGPDGTVWQDVGIENGEAGPVGQEGLARLAGGEWAEWTSADLPDISLGFGRDGEFKAASDGSLWFSLWRSADGRDPRGDDEWGGDTDSAGLDWRWVAPSYPVETGHLVCDGLARFDGVTLDRFLPGQCISMDIVADDSVWVLADEKHGADLYVITPEVVAAAE